MQKPFSGVRRRRVKRRRTRASKKLDVRVEASKQYAWRLLDRLTDDLAEWLTDSERAEVKAIVRSRNFSRYNELSKCWGLQSISSSKEFPGPAMATKLLLGAVIRKYPLTSAVTDTEKRDVAITNVVATNRSCSWFNRHGWKRLFVDGYPTPELLLMRKFVEMVIGALPPEGGRLTEWSRHGPGSDTATLLGRCSPYDKYVEWPYRVTARSQEHARMLISDDERWLGALEDSYRRKFHIKPWEILNWDTFWDTVLINTEHNKVTTVPKDGLKDRPIAIEPRLNLMLQLGVDGFIRRRLKRFGVNLDSQEWNQELAYEGSIRTDADTPVTIDLSNASDTISLRLVKLLFPKAWYTYLCDLRCPNGIIPGRAKLRYSKLSSMGNGYTFAVETLIFCAICYAALKVSGLRWDKSHVAVFGDDMIVPQSSSAPLLNLLHMCGLEANTDKSFLSGRVRESCGTDWVSGTNMRPVFIKEEPETVCDYFAHRNLLVRWAQQFTHSKLESTEQFYLDLIPKHLHVWGPRSDEEFSTYLHTPVPQGWISDPASKKRSPWSYHFEYISCTLRPQRGNEFLFRKLMHSLRSTGRIENQWLKRKFKSGGSRFTVTNRNRFAYSKRVRQVPQWDAEYCYVPDWLRDRLDAGL